jgi:CRP-like cAMP-binding protein
MHQNERLAALKRVPILTELPHGRLKELDATCKWRDYSAGEQILGYRDPSTEVFFLGAGKVRVIIYSVEGKTVLFGASRCRP